MSSRMNLPAVAPDQFQAMMALEASIVIDPVVKELVKLRASQINGCAFCVDMHWKDARAAGESEDRLYMLNAWRESSLYDARERAALALCESMTVLDHHGVPDDIWEAASSEFPNEELAQLVFCISAINTWNRLMVSIRSESGHYRPKAHH